MGRLYRTPLEPSTKPGVKPVGPPENVDTVALEMTIARTTLLPVSATYNVESGVLMALGSSVNETGAVNLAFVPTPLVKPTRNCPANTDTTLV